MKVERERKQDQRHILPGQYIDAINQPMRIQAWSTRLQALQGRMLRHVMPIAPRANGKQADDMLCRPDAVCNM